MDEQERLQAANELIATIAGCGRRFFHWQGKTSRLELDGRGRVWFIDKHSGKRIYTHYSGRWRGFTQGGTLQAFVQRIRDFIKRGTKLSPVNFGARPDWYSNGRDVWDYGEELGTVLDAARRLGILQEQTGSEA